MAKYTNYLQMMENQYGDTWLTRVTPDNIQRSVKRIVREIAKGNISYENLGQYFLDLKFMENLIIGICNELEINTLNLNSCRFYFNYYPSTPNLSQHILCLERINYIYSVVLERLNYVKGTGNIGYMVDIQGLLFNDRKYLDLL